MVGELHQPIDGRHQERLHLLHLEMQEPHERHVEEDSSLHAHGLAHVVLGNGRLLLEKAGCQVLDHVTATARLLFFQLRRQHAGEGIVDVDRGSVVVAFGHDANVKDKGLLDHEVQDEQEPYQSNHLWVEHVDFPAEKDRSKGRVHLEAGRNEIGLDVFLSGFLLAPGFLFQLVGQDGVLGFVLGFVVVVVIFFVALLLFRRFVILGGIVFVGFVFGFLDRCLLGFLVVVLVVGFFRFRFRFTSTERQNRSFLEFREPPLVARSALDRTTKGGNPGRRRRRQPRGVDHQYHQGQEE
mmetsp:Transcript_13130/g.36937  ORF Transcript_13130/g.36937 Transcript_13130/m.36937 type:complete len:296 (-) Transcript_13130:266-1153(-)